MESRGQTTLDFAMGISIFLAVVLFVFTFVPGLLDPFALNSEEDTVLVGQIADRLSKDALGHPEEPYVLDRYCAVAFFNGSKTAPSRCRYEGQTLAAKLDVPDSTNVNVTIESNITIGSTDPDTLCWDEGEKDLVPVANCNPGGADTALTIGESPSAAGTNPATITARRVVALDGEDVTLTVVVW